MVVGSDEFQRLLYSLNLGLERYFMSYYDLYFCLYEDSNPFYFCDSEICSLFGLNSDNISYSTYNRLISLLSSSIESGFNEGFKFAMKIFLNNL